MNTFEELQDEACKDGIEVIENYPFTSDRIEGLYVDSTIALSKGLTTCAEKSCVLAEELGHHYTASGDIINQSNAENRKQELRGRIWAYNKQIGLTGLVNAYRSHCQNALADSLDYYRSKYGCCVQIDNFVIFFEPNIAVMELI